MAELVHTEKPLTEDEYKDFERLFRQKIPPSFKANYMAHNGGFPAEEDVEAGRWGFDAGFVPIKHGKLPIERLVEDIEDIENIEPKDRKFGVWEKFSFVPFASDSGGIVFISLRDDDYGHVYIYFCDGDNIFKICASFEEFRSRLYTPKTQ
jgi:hypothetical protein